MKSLRCWLLGVLGCGWTFAAPAAPPAADMVPAAAVEFLSLTQLNDLESGWKASQFGQLWKEPALQPFLNNSGLDVLGLLELPRLLGWNWEDVKKLSAGEIASAGVPIGEYRVAHVFLMPIAGGASAAQAARGQCLQRLQAAGTPAKRQALAGREVDVVELTVEGKKRALGIWVRDDCLFVTEPPEAIAAVARTLETAGAPTLAKHATFQTLGQRTAMKPSEKVQLRWYFDPFGHDRATRKPLAAGEKPKKKDAGQFLREEGFDAVQAVGLSLGFTGGHCDLVARGSVLATPPYRKGLNVVSFRAGPEFPPPDWVPARISTCGLGRVDAVQSFEAFAGFFDYLTGGDRGAFKDVIDDLKNEPDGPKVDIRQEIIKQIGDQVVILSDSVKPIDRRSARGVAVFPVKDAKVVSRAILNLMRNDKNASRTKIGNREVWVLRPRPKKAKPGEAPAPPAPDAALYVDEQAGLFYIATHASLLERLFRPGEPPLAQDGDYRRIRTEWQSRAGATNGWRQIHRIAEDIHLTYEMWRTNQLDKAESIYSQSLHRWLKARAEAGVPVKLLAEKLPDYALVSKYLGLLALQVEVHPQGWDIVGFTLPPANR